GIAEFPLVVKERRNRALNRSAVHMYVEDVQKDADSVLLLALVDELCHGGDFSVSRRNHDTRAIRNNALRITKEPEKERAQQHRRQSEPRVNQAQKYSRYSCTQAIVKAVTNHK